MFCCKACLRFVTAFLFTCSFFAPAYAVRGQQLRSTNATQQITNATTLSAFTDAEVNNALWRLRQIVPGGASETEAQAKSAQTDVYGTTRDGAASIYGEIQPNTVVKMLRMVDARPGQRYYDLGSGRGQSVVLAWLLGLNATGVELGEDRWRRSCAAVQRASASGASNSTTSHKSTGGCRFIRANFLKFDFSDADIVFTNSVMFDDATMEGIAQAARLLRPGTKVVASHMGLPGPGFKKIGTVRGDVSWTDRDSFWSIQVVEEGAASHISTTAAPFTVSKALAPTMCTV